MGLHLSLYILFIFLSTNFLTTNAKEILPFSQNYVRNWGRDHINILDQGREVQIKIDEWSGGGIKSKQAYGSGLFKLNIKIPKHSNGIVTTFYLSSAPSNGPFGAHSELDFMIMNRNGLPYKLHTNIFAEDGGQREQDFDIWFDPTSDFHEYKILWNHHQIVFLVDEFPVRVFKKFEKMGTKYPKSPMYVHASVWNRTQWLGQPDWSKGEFYANFRGFEIDGCGSSSSSSSPNSKCESPEYSWNSPEFHQLDGPHQRVYENIRNRYMTYDYCNNHTTSNFPAECNVNS